MFCGTWVLPQVQQSRFSRISPVQERGVIAGGGLFKEQQVQHSDFGFVRILGLQPKASRGSIPSVAGPTFGEQPAVVDGASKSIQCGGVDGDLDGVIQITVFHLAQQSEELMIGEAPEGLEIGEAILAKMPSMKRTAQLTGDSNW